MKILVSNVGSTSLKFKLYDMPSEAVLCEAKVERGLQNRAGQRLLRHTRVD